MGYVIPGCGLAPYDNWGNYWGFYAGKPDICCIAGACGGGYGGFDGYGGFRRRKCGCARGTHPCCKHGLYFCAGRVPLSFACCTEPPVGRCCPTGYDGYDGYDY